MAGCQDSEPSYVTASVAELIVKININGRMAWIGWTHGANEARISTAPQRRRNAARAGTNLWNHTLWMIMDTQDDQVLLRPHGEWTPRTRLSEQYRVIS